MMIARLAATVLAGSFLATAGCGGEPAASREELTDFEQIADQAVQEDSKADTTSASTLVIGEIQPSTPVSTTVSPSRPVVGWTLRSDGDAGSIAATARAIPPGGGGTSPAPVVLYRRLLNGAPSCLGEWVRIASGAAAINPSLPGPGDYMLVTGLSTATRSTGSGSGSSGSVPVQVEYRADDSSKIVTPAYIQDRPYKIAKSWLPTTAQQKLVAAGLKRFSEITPDGSGIKTLAARTGLAPDALRELERLKGWLDTPGVTYPMACALKRAGLSSVEDYYGASYATQQRLIKDGIRPGTLNVPDDYVPGRDGLPRPRPPGPCVRLDAPSPQQPQRSPYLDWQWWEKGSRVADRIDGKPWWDAHNSGRNDPRWFPDPQQGWEVFAYNLGRPPELKADFPDDYPEDAAHPFPPSDDRAWFTPKENAGASGYLLMNNRKLGLMRLFVYIPTSKAYNGLVAAVSLKNRSGRDIGTWSFPLEPTPPGYRSVASLWQLDKPYEDNSPGFAPLLSQGTWVRSEFPTLFDPALYNTGDEVRLNVAIRGIDQATGNGELNGVINASGTSAPADATTDYVAVARNILVSVGKKDLGGLARRVLTLLADPVDPQHIALSGKVMGSFGAVNLARRADSDLWVRLSGTYTALSDQQKFREYGGWGGFQRCHRSRVGAIGFETAALTARPGEARDPWPTIPVNINSCETGNWTAGVATFGTRSTQCGKDARSGAGTAELPAAQLNIARLRKAPWSDITILSERAALELYEHNGAFGPDPDGRDGPEHGAWIPPTALPMGRSESPVDPQGNVTFKPLQAPMPPEKWVLMLRWMATISSPGMRPFTFSYALDVSRYLEIVNTAGCNWYDVQTIINSSPPRVVTHRECERSP